MGLQITLSLTQEACGEVHVKQMAAYLHHSLTEYYPEASLVIHSRQSGRACVEVVTGTAAEEAEVRACIQRLWDFYPQRHG